MREQDELASFYSVSHGYGELGCSLAQRVWSHRRASRDARSRKVSCNRTPEEPFHCRPILAHRRPEFARPRPAPVLWVIPTTAGEYLLAYLYIHSCMSLNGSTTGAETFNIPECPGTVDTIAFEPARDPRLSVTYGAVVMKARSPSAHCK